MTASADTIDVRFKFRAPPPDIMETAETFVSDVARSFGALSVNLLPSKETYRWIKRMNIDSRTKTGNDLIRNRSAVMHNIKADLELDAQ